MRLWAILADGARACFFDPWRAPFAVDAADWPRAQKALAGFPAPLDVAPGEGSDLYSERVRPVVVARVSPPRHAAVVHRLKRAGLTLYNADFPPEQHHHYERGHFPLAFGDFDVDGDRLRGFRLRDDPWARDYALPPLRFVHLALAGSEFAGAINPAHAARGGLVLRHEGLTHALEGDPAEQLESLDRRLREWDPDVLTTDWGDDYLIPRLLAWARRAGRPLRLSRDPDRNALGRGGRSYVAYGQTVFRAGAQRLFGRWHLDLKNSFFFKESGFAGLFEIARIAKIPVQRTARVSIGTALSSMQLDVALRRGLLVPLDKAQTEDFRPASDLVRADKGGLVYEPDVGWFEGVAEYDFVSMYPTLMVRRNISPETVNCSCCDPADADVVPEIGHRLCRRRRGLVPEVLAPILEKRAAYKRLAKTDHPRAALYKARADAHKWTLVTCFGYLGYKNARFGKIEAHESVTAWGRESLLRAKDFVEARGFRVLHANVDCVWVRGPRGARSRGGAARPGGLCRRPGGPGGRLQVAAVLSLQDGSRWRAFRTAISGLSPTGRSRSGAWRCGGGTRRRSSRPCKTTCWRRWPRPTMWRAAAPGRGAWPTIAAAVRERLAAGRASIDELAVAFSLSRDPADYRGAGPSAVAARRLAASGVRLRPGETVRYLIAAAGDKIAEARATPLAFVADEAADWDVKKYLELWRRCRDEIRKRVRRPRNPGRRTA
jgi:DNA polymerase-2